MLHVQLLLNGFFLGVGALWASLTVKGLLPHPDKIIDAQSAKRPTIPRQWLAMAFWSNLVLAVMICGISIGTAEHALAPVWNDVMQLLIWLVLIIDSAVAQRRVWLALSVVFMVFSGYEVATHL